VLSTERQLKHREKNISIFYAIDKKESFLILSMLNMQFKRIWINMIARTWCFDVNEHAFELFFAQAFVKVLQDESTVYAFVMINIIEELIIEHCYERAQSSTETHVLWASLDSIESSAYLFSVHIVFASHRSRSLALKSRLPDLFFVYLYFYDLL